MMINVCPPDGAWFVLLDYSANLGAHINIVTGEVRAWRASWARDPVDCAVFWL